MHNADKKVEDRILVVSLSVGFLYFPFEQISKTQENYLLELKEKLEAQHCYIIDSEAFDILNYFISSPIYNDSLDKIIDFEPGQDWDTENFIKYNPDTKLLVPGGGRLYAFPSDIDEYYYCGTASYSWSIPIVASFFAIAKTITPKLSLKDFTEIAFKTCDINSKKQKIINIKNICDYLKIKNENYL